MSSAITTRDEFLTYLKSLGLPVDMPLQKVKTSTPSRKSPHYPFEIVEFGQPTFPGQLSPFWFVTKTPWDNGEDSDLLPPYGYTAFLDLGGDKAKNHEKALQHLKGLFGSPTNSSGGYSQLHEWDFGYAKAQLQTPPGNPDSVLHPELDSLCAVDLWPRDLSPLTAEKQNDIDQLKPLAALNTKMGILPDTQNLFSMSGCRGVNCYLGEPRHGKQLGLSPDSRRLVGVEGHYAWHIDKELVTSIQLTRAFPARAAGGSMLRMKFTDPLSSMKRTCELGLAGGGEPSGLDALAQELERWHGKPLEISEYYAD